MSFLDSFVKSKRVSKIILSIILSYSNNEINLPEVVVLLDSTKTFANKKLESSYKTNSTNKMIS